MDAPAPAPRRRKLLKRSAWTAGALLALGTGGLLATTGCLATFGGTPDRDALEKRVKSARYENGKFVNLEPRQNATPGFEVMKEFFFSKLERVPPGPLPIHDPAPTWRTQAPTGLRVTWLGHSSILVEIDGYRVLTDPMWAARASPSSFAGPRRFHDPPAKLDDLPPLDAVIISHDHYDHLDMETVQTLGARKVHFYVPLGVGAHFDRWGVDPSLVTELDWWGEADIPGTDVHLVSTPARHFSGRGIFDRDKTLWSSWVIRTPRRRVYFSGDTGLSSQFESIKTREGPFDLLMLEVGAFHPSWGDIHLGPDGAVQAYQTLGGGGALLPIHWSTFNLGIHAWDDPAVRLKQLADQKQLPLVTPELGAPIDIPPAEATGAWWKKIQKTPASSSRLDQSAL